MNEKATRNTRNDIANLYPRLTGDRVTEVHQRLKDYVAIVLRIHARIQSDPRVYAQFKALQNSKSDLRSDRRF